MKYPNYYFCGVGGNGMSPLARLLCAQGATVRGSDRNYDSGVNQSFFNRLVAEGITLCPQDGTGVCDGDVFVVTRAVEESIPDVQRARELNLKILRRPELMEQMFALTRNIAIGGTSGKSTTTAMVGFILEQLSRDPTIVDGAEMINFGSHFRLGKSEQAVFEADESDGLKDVIALCPTEVAVLTNISLDHFELPELEKIFEQFVARATVGVVINADCQYSMKLARYAKKVVTFGLTKTADINPHALSVRLSIPGDHNIANALAAIAATSLLGIDPQEAARVLARFRGIRRRLEQIGSSGDIAVYDDFASNPGKIGATIRTLRGLYSRVIAIFQPHGFQPTKVMRQGYVDTFSSELRAEDILIFLPIYYAGGQYNSLGGQLVELPKDISSSMVVQELDMRRSNNFNVFNRQDALRLVKSIGKPGDVVVVMGSRDESLPDFAQTLLTAFSK